VKQGDEAPDFELQDQDDQPVRLSGLRGKQVVLYFYPKADTPGCTKQACGIRDHFADYEGSGAVVLGVSPDKPEKLRKFADKYSLPFTLLADVDHEVAESYGVWRQLPVLGHNKRTTFLIDAEGRIEEVFEKVSPASHDEMLLEALGAGA
jgi:peroxiredoxin Q/BCP